MTPHESEVGITTLSGDQILAGLDERGRSARLYVKDRYGLREIGHREWCNLLDSMGAEPGECLFVTLSRQNTE